MDRLIEHVQAEGFPPGVSMRAIARAIGTSHTRLRTEFGSRADLLAQVMKEARLRDHDLYYNTASEFGIVDALLAWWSRVTDGAHRPRGQAFWTLMAAAANDPQDYPDTVETLRQPVRHFAMLAAAAGLPPDEALRRSRIACATFMGLLLEVSLGESAEDAGHLLRDVVTDLFGDISSTTPPDKRPRRSISYRS
jgi:AcrR family transcriptional regulator